jgi:hypothetical protein
VTRNIWPNELYDMQALLMVARPNGKPLYTFPGRRSPD